MGRPIDTALCGPEECLMPVQAPNPFGSFLEGRQARQQEDYANTRNALARMEAENAPQEMARRNRLLDLQVQGAERQYSQEQITQSLQQTAAAASRLAQSSNPRAEAGVYGEFMSKLREQNPELDSYNDQQFKEYMGWIAGEAQAKLGIAPAQADQQLQLQQTDGPHGSKVLTYGNTMRVVEQPKPQQPQGPNWRLVDMPQPDGTIQKTWVDESNPNAAPKPFGAPVNERGTGTVSEGERKAAALGTRLEDALRTLGQLEKASPGVSRPGVGEKLAGAFGETAANLARNSERQQADTAQLDALDAALTLATGAAYTAEQLNNLRKSYFPQLGDSDATVKAKQKRFETIVQTARIAAGRAEPSINQALGGPAPSQSAPTQQQAPAAAIEHLRRNPQLKGAFRQKYGYLPDGF